MKHADEDRSKQLEHGLTRRTLLGGTSAAAAAAVLGQSARATPGAGSRPTLVQVFLRGAMDGLTTVVPYADGDLYVWRPTLAVPPPGAANGALDLDGFFGLAPAAAPLLTPYASGHLAIVHASGSSGPTRSHFDGFLRMEFGDPGLPAGTIRSGWITRYLQQTAPQATSPLRAISTSFLLPYTLAGATGALPIPDLGNFLFPGDAGTAARRGA